MTEPLVDAPARRWSAGRLVVALLVAAMVAMWGYVLYLALGPGRQDPPDRLDDPAFAPVAEARCDEALDAVALLPSAAVTETPDDRAEAILAANRIFSAMLDDLAELAPAGEDGAIVEEWLDDWATYLDDRAAYAEAVRRDPDAQLVVTAKDNEQVTEYIDAFAADNHIPACGTPVDV